MFSKINNKITKNSTEKSILRRQLDKEMKINLSIDSDTSENYIYNYSDINKEDNINMLSNINNFSSNKNIKIHEIPDSFNCNIEIKTDVNSEITNYVNEVEFYVCDNYFQQDSETSESDISNINETEFDYTNKHHYQRNSKREVQNRNKEIATINFYSRTKEEFNNYVTEVKFCSNSSEEDDSGLYGSINSIVPKQKMYTSEEYVQNFNDEIDKNKGKLTNYMNEIVFFVNNIHDNSEDGNSVKDSLDISSHKQTNEKFTNYVNEIEFFVNNIHDDNSEDGNSAKDFLDISSHKQTNGKFTNYVNEIVFFVNNIHDDNSEDRNYVKDSLDISSHKQTNGKFTNYVNEIVFFVNNIHDDYSEDGNTVKDPLDISSHKQTNGKFTHYVNEIVFFVNNIHDDNSEDGNSVKDSLDISSHMQTNGNFTNYANEIVFYDNNIHDDNGEDGNSVKDPLDISLPNEYKDVSNSTSIPACKNQTKNNSYIYNHLIPRTTNAMENNPLEASLNMFLENEKNREDFKDSNSTIKDNSESHEDLDINSHNKFNNYENQWLTITSDSTNFFNDDILSTDKLPRRRLSVLDFRFSEIERNSDNTNFFDDDILSTDKFPRRRLTILDFTFSEIERNIDNTNFFDDDILSTNKFPRRRLF